MSSHDVRVLRAITFRLGAAAHQELPNLIRSIARQLLDCKALLSSSTAVAKDQSGAVLVHKLKTQINTFLNAKTIEGRWAGVMLAKTALEAGGLELLSNCQAWTRSLLQIVKKPDPVATRKLAILTLTRIFDLTRNHQTLTRELTTPSMKEFVPICIGLITPDAPDKRSVEGNSACRGLLPTVLQSFAHLLPHHPSIFRPQIMKLRSLVLPIAVDSTSLEDRLSAQKLFAALHYSGAKTGGSNPADEYTKTFSATLQALHMTVSLVFRSVLEDWKPLPGTEVPELNVPTESDINSEGARCPLELPSWTGLEAGCDRIFSLISLIDTFLSSSTATQVAIPQAAIVDALVRLCSVTIPTAALASKGKMTFVQAGIRSNDQISQSERDALFVHLPFLHAAAIGLIPAICGSLSGVMKSLHITFFEQVLWVFQRERRNEEVRIACYKAIAWVMATSAGSSSKDINRQLLPVIDSCCNDLSGSLSAQKAEVSGVKGLSTDIMSKSGQSTTLSAANKHQIAAADAASALLEAALQYIPPAHLPQSARSKLDRTAILTQNQEAMLASVLNPPLSTGGSKVQTSILPFLAQADSDCLTTEGILRPRVPVVTPDLGRDIDDEDEDEEDDEMEEDQELDEDGDEMDEDHDGSTPALPLEVTSAMMVDGVGSTLKESDDLPAPGLKRPAMETHTDNPRTQSPKRQRLDQSAEQADNPTPTPEPSIPDANALNPSTATVMPDPPTTSARSKDTQQEPPKPEAGKATEAVLEQSQNVTLHEIAGKGVAGAGAAPLDKILNPSGDVDSDDEDFEIPEINLESDTDEEEEEDE